ncbi:MAG: PAS domain S-box protein [Methylobacter sp.]
MKLDVLPESSSKNDVGLAQETCLAGTLQSELYRHMAEDISAPAVFVADPRDGYRLLHASASCRNFGDSHETLHGMPLPEYIPTLTLAQLKKLWQKIGEYNTASMETDFRLASGSRIAIKLIFSRLECEGRKLMVGYIYDTSERRALEAERLRLAEEIAGQEIEFRYREIFENVTDGIFLLDVVHGERFRFVGINPSMTRMTGMIQRNILGRFVENIIPEHSARKMIANYRQCVEEGKPVRFEMELELSGSKKLFNSTLIPVRNEFGYIHRIISLSSDITERKAADMQIALLNYSLDRVKESVLLTGEDAQLYYVNEEFCRGLGYSRDELLGLGVPDFDPDYQLDRWPEHWSDLKENGSLIFESRHKTKDGRIYPVEIIANYFEFDGKGYNLALMRDIAERKRVEDTLKFIAQRGWAEGGESFLTALARYLGQMLEADYVIVDKLADDPANAETVAVYAKGEVLPNMQYSLKGTPCANVMGGGLCCYPADVQQRFPEDSLLVDMQIESYAGLPLWDSKGKVIGLIAVMDGKPIGDAATVTSMLQLVATRASAELEREQSERALSESRQFLNQVIETIPDPIFVKDREHRWIRLNQAFCGFIGHPLEALLGKSDYDFFPAHEADVFWAKDEAVFNSGEENVNEEEFTGSDGITRTLVTKKTCYTDDRGQQYLVGIILDITERKRLEAELISQTNFQRTLLNATCDVGMQLMVVENGRISHVGNRKLAYQFGYTDAELDAHPALIDIIHPDDRARVMDYHARRMAGEAVPASYELGLLMRGGERREYETSVAIVPDTDPMRIITVGKDITERKAIGEKLVLLDYALDHVEEAVYLIDEEAGFVQINEAACKMLGYTRDELLSMRIFDIDPDFGPEQWQQFKNSRHDGTLSMTLETHHKTKDGRIFPVEVSANHIDYQGQNYDMALVRDITERKRVEEAIQRSQTLLKEAQRIAHIGSWEVDMVNGVLTWSDETFRIWEIDKAHFGATIDAFLETVHPEDRENVAHAYSHSVNNKTLYQIEHRLLFPDGRVKYIAERGEPFYDADGKPLRFVGTALDITERKQMEAAVRQREQEFRVLVEYSPDPIFRYDKECRRTYANPAVERLTGKSAASLRNRVPSDASVFSMREGKKLVQMIRQVLETGRTAESEVEFIAPDGRLHYFHNRYAPEFDSHGEVAGVISIACDITDRKLAENLLYQREREFRTLVKNLPTYVVRIDPELRRVYVNPAYVEFADISEETLLGSHISAFWRAINISADAYIEILKHVLRCGVQQEVPLEWTDGDGCFVSHIVRIAPEYGQNGAVRGLLVLGFDDSERRRQQMQEAARQRVFEKMAHGGDLNEILEQVALYIESSSPSRRCCILLLNEERNRLYSAAAPSFSASCPASLDGVVVGEDSGCCGTVAWRGERLTVENLLHYARPEACRAFARETGVLGFWSEPIVTSSGRVLGVVAVYLSQAGEPGDQDLILLRHASQLSAIAIERKRIEELMHLEASYDSLSGLPNRRLFCDRLREEIAKAERGGYSLAMLFIDLDRFKEVNDTLGHEAGDSLLVEAAQRIRACVRESDTVARLAGDEFVVILAEVGEIAPQNRVAQSIVESMARPFRIGEHIAYVSASIGIAGYPQDADNVETLMGCADQAMYAAKQAGRNSFSFFTRRMQEQAQQRLHLTGDLRDALGKGQLEVYYQPIIDVASSLPVKAEALLRWRHPQHGMVSPEQFIPIAEETGLIQEIGTWVFREAADTVKRWNALTEEEGMRQISVNMSPRQFVRGNPDVLCIEYLQAIGLNPKAVVIEITEGLLLDDQADVLNKLRHFHEAGMELALDDFGTGYSAMAYLKKFNIDYIKIDRSFVRDLETDPSDRAIAEAIVAMAHRLGLKVIAEGVETEGQRALLMAVGCEYVQGYLYAKPMPAEMFLEYVLGR